MDTQFPVLCSSKPMKSGSEIFERIPITKNVFKLGRGHHNTFVIPYKCLSKDHCIFKKEEEDWILQNCSYSSIKVNGNKLRKGDTQKVCDQDIIKLDTTNELVYTFMVNSKVKRRRHKLDKDSSNDRKKSASPKSKRIKLVANTQTKEEIMSEQSKKEKEIYDDYAARIEKVKGSKKVVKRQRGLLRIRRNTQLELVRVKTEEKMASLMAQEKESLNENKQTKKPSSLGDGDQKSASKEKLDQSEERREQDRMRMKEKKELRKLRRETRRLKLDKEKKLKELEKQKLRREKELQDELNKVNKKLAKERELHEKERRRVKQLLDQKKEELKKVSPSTSSDPKLDVESELQCSICSELFVIATTLGCSHTYCRYCIRKWTANKQECPICRAPITSECRSIVLDSLVDKMANTADEKKKRQELVKARGELEAKERTTVPNREPQHNPFISIIPDFMYDENSNSSSQESDSQTSPEDDSDMLVPMDTDSGPSGLESPSTASDDYRQYEDEHYEEMQYGGYESGSQENENYDDAPEEEEEHEEDYSPDDENDEGEHSPSENDEGEHSTSENYDEGENSAPESYEEEHSAPEFDGENSEPEDYDEGGITEPENYDEGDNSAPEYDEDDNSPPEYDEDDNSPPEYDEGDNSPPEYDEGDNSPAEYDEGHNSPPEYDEGDNSPAEYDEGDNSPPEYDEGDNSPAEYDGDSYPDDDGDYY